MGHITLAQRCVIDAKSMQYLRMHRNLFVETKKFAECLHSVSSLLVSTINHRFQKYYNALRNQNIF